MHHSLCTLVLSKVRVSKFLTTCTCVQAQFSTCEQVHMRVANVYRHMKPVCMHVICISGCLFLLVKCKCKH